MVIEDIRTFSPSTTWLFVRNLSLVFDLPVYVTRPLHILHFTFVLLQLMLHLMFHIIPLVALKEEHS